ncbi:MAG: DoxX family protein [Candidatus Thermoplasmatota archaeon]
MPRFASSRAEAIVVALLVLLFAYEGADKTLGRQDAFFASIGYPTWSGLAIGLFELALAVALLIRPLRLLAALGVLATMVGAGATILSSGRNDLWPLTLAAAGLASWLVVTGWRSDPLVQAIRQRV